MGLTQIFCTVFFISMTSCTKPVPSQTCFSLNGQPNLTIGDKLNINSLKITYGLDEAGKNFGKNSGFKDYVSVDTSLSIYSKIGQIIGALSFTHADNTNELISLNGFWMFIIADKPKDRLTGLQALKNKFLGCLDLEKIDINKGGEYKVRKNGWTETFTLTPRIQEDGTDVNYWAFYYSCK